jgi:hypothetical protein
MFSEFRVDLVQTMGMIFWVIFVVFSEAVREVAKNKNKIKLIHVSLVKISNSILSPVFCDHFIFHK